MKERHLFKCTKCDHEVHLQAWKSVCPSCGSAFTLVRVVRPRLRVKFMPRYAVSALLTFTLISSLLVEPLNPLRHLSPQFFLPLSTVLLITALFALSGSLVGNLVTVSCGLLLIALWSGSFHLLGLGLSLVGLGLLDESLVRWRARRMRED